MTTTISDEVILKYQNLVRRVVHTFLKGKDESMFEDLFQEGCIALLKALQTFDPSKNVKFSTYAYRIIYNHVYLCYFITFDSIVKPKEILHLYRRYQDYLEEYFTCHQQKPSDEEIISYLDTTVENLKHLKRLPYLFPTSLELPLPGQSQLFLEDTVYDDTIREEDFGDKVDRDRLAYCLKKCLDPNEYYIVYHRYLSDCPLKQVEISKDVLTDRNIISERNRRILKKLKSKMMDSQKQASIVDFINQYYLSDADFKNSRLEPNSLDDVTLLYYMNTHVSYLEYCILYLMDYDDSYHSFEFVAKVCHLPVKEVRLIYQKLKEFIPLIPQEELSELKVQLVERYNLSKLLDMDSRILPSPLETSTTKKKRPLRN